MPVGLLHPLKVVEVGESVAVAFSGKILADLGAQVIRVEPPGGSRLRDLPPFVENQAARRPSVLHDWLCANKRSLILNLGDERGQAIFHDLLGRAHVLVRTDRPPIDAARVRRSNPGLSVTTITPFGCDGPYAGYRGDALTLFALSGFSYYLACPVDDPATTPPKRNPGHQVGLVAGLLAAIATLSGVLGGKAEGRGRTIDVSEWEAFTHLLYEHTSWLSAGTLPNDRRRKPGAVITVVGGLVWCLPCSDGWVMISPREDHQFKQWGALIGAPEWATDERFATPSLRERHAWEIYERSAAWTIHRPKADVYAAAQERKVASFPVSVMSDLPRFEQLAHRGFWLPLAYPGLKDVMVPGLPAKFEGVEAVPSMAAPAPGQHTAEICAELGIPATELEDLGASHVI